MIEIILLAGAVSVELEPYAVENPETATSEVGTSSVVDGKVFQWTTRRSISGKAPRDSNNLDSYGNKVERDAFGRPVAGGE